MTNGEKQEPAPIQPTGTASEFLEELLSGLPEWLKEPLMEYSRQIVAGIVILLLAVALWSGYSTYDRNQENMAATALGAALEKGDPAARASALKEVVRSHSRSEAARHALLLLAAAERDAGMTDEAKKLFSQARARYGKDSICFQSAVMGEAYIDEQAGDNKSAAKGFQIPADKELGLEAIALLDLARVQAELGNKDQALSAYNRFLALKPGSKSLDFVRYQIMKLS